jgi:hypothetical protein
VLRHRSKVEQLTRNSAAASLVVSRSRDGGGIDPLSFGASGGKVSAEGDASTLDLALVACRALRGRPCNLSCLRCIGPGVLPLIYDSTTWNFW